jgi:hypothetical protein
MSLYTAVAEHIAANHPDLTYSATGVGGQIFVATMPTAPDTDTKVNVAVMAYGGAEEATAQPTDLPLVQLIIRGPRFDPRPALATWADLYRLFAGMTSTEIGTSDPVHVHMCTPLQSGPIALGKDANDRHEFTLNLQFRVHAPSLHRPALTP